MSLTLTIVNVDKLDNGEPNRLLLDKHGLVIGRSSHADWSLPDPKAYISSTHCEIDFRDGQYVLTDRSTNGTYLNGAADRLAAPHVIRDGDEILIGHYRLKARLEGAAGAASGHDAGGAGSAQAGGWAGWGPSSAPAPAATQWGAQAATPPAPPEPSAAPGWGAAPAAPGWGSAPAAAASPAPGWGPSPAPAAPAPAPGWNPAPATPVASAAWGDVAPPAPTASQWAKDESFDGPGAAVSGRGAMAQSWTPPRADVAAPSGPDWSQSGWSAPAPQTDSWGQGSGSGAGSGPGDVWARLASTEEVDWSRGFAASAPAPAPSAAPQPAPASAGPELWSVFLTAAGITPGDLKGDNVQAARTAGDILRRLVGGLVVMLEARARAKAQLGAQSTTLELDGNNPLKFARTPERVVAQLLNPPERGFMGADRAVEASYQDLQAHQMATLAAMQSALRSTLARFSPEAIRQRAEMRGLLAKILPGARDAALWQAYEREFEGVAQGSDEAFMDVFSKAFKQAYEEAAAKMKGRT